VARYAKSCQALFKLYLQGKHVDAQRGHPVAKLNMTNLPCAPFYLRDVRLSPLQAFGQLLLRDADAQPDVSKEVGERLLLSIKRNALHVCHLLTWLQPCMLSSTSR
jgi:hypothetical protein